jgi:hypothetical protein
MNKRGLKRNYFYSKLGGWLIAVTQFKNDPNSDNFEEETVDSRRYGIIGIKNKELLERFPDVQMNDKEESLSVNEELLVYYLNKSSYNGFQDWKYSNNMTNTDLIADANIVIRNTKNDILEEYSYIHRMDY